MTDSKVNGMGLMRGRRGLIMGVANNHSIAWGIARVLAANGAELAFTYQGDAQAKRLKPLAASIGAEILLPGDVEDDDQLDEAFSTLAARWGSIDFLVHAIAHSDKNELKGRYVDTTRANFVRSLSISCYSFTAVARRAAQLMAGRGERCGSVMRGRDGGCATVRRWHRTIHAPMAVLDPLSISRWRGCRAPPTRSRISWS